MSTAKTLEIKSTSLEDTASIGAKLAQNLKGGDVIELSSDIGGGKTTLVRSIVAGLGSDDVVASPTFAISKVYKTPKYTVHHFDFYRLHDAADMAAELAEIIGDSHNICIIEWSSVVQHVLPQERLTVSIDRTPDDGRIFSFTDMSPDGHFVEGLC